MLYSEKLKAFEAAHPCAYLTVDGASFRYVLSGQHVGKTLVLLNGGMNTLAMLRVEKPVFIGASDGNYCDYYITGNQE